jgi:transcriptional regulator with XRE-family HTH domain
MTDHEALKTQERLILEVTETIVGILDEQKMSRQQLAIHLGKTKGFVSQLLSGERNMTLRTLAKLGYVLGYEFHITGRHFRSCAVDSVECLPDGYRASDLLKGDQIYARGDWWTVTGLTEDAGFVTITAESSDGESSSTRIHGIYHRFAYALRDGASLTSNTLPK